MTLLFSEVKDLNIEVAHLITTVRLAREANKDGNEPAAADRGIAAFNRLTEIGNRLAHDIPGKPSIWELVAKYPDHGYRPSLRAARGTPEKLLADIYDLVAEVDGVDVKAYRQGFDADGNR